MDRFNVEVCGSPSLSTTAIERFIKGLGAELGRRRFLPDELEKLVDRTRSGEWVAVADGVRVGSVPRSIWLSLLSLAFPFGIRTRFVVPAAVHVALAAVLLLALVPRGVAEAGASSSTTDVQKRRQALDEQVRRTVDAAAPPIGPPTAIEVTPQRYGRAVNPVPKVAAVKAAAAPSPRPAAELPTRVTIGPLLIAGAVVCFAFALIAFLSLLLPRWREWRRRRAWRRKFDDEGGV